MRVLLGEKEQRALKILKEHELHEDDKFPLETAQHLVKLGFAKNLPFQKVFERGRWFNVRQIIITQEGRNYLENLHDKK